MIDRTLLKVLDELARPRVLVVGDVMLDRYTWGNAERVSPEAPVLVLNADQQEVRLGGAGSVAGLLQALGAEVTLTGVVGDDAGGRTVRMLLDEARIVSWLAMDQFRPTTVKERFLGRAADRHSHQVLRVDHEVRDPISGNVEAEVLKCIHGLDEFQAVLISDYSKGVCTHSLLRKFLKAAKECDIPVLIDPGKSGCFDSYRGADLVTPNRKKLESETGIAINEPTDALCAAAKLRQRHSLQAVLATLDSDGLALVRRDASVERFPTRPRKVYDVTGAGDMVLAFMGLAYASGIPLDLGARLANVAAGLEVERLGVVAVTREDIRADLAGGAEGEKLVTLDDAAALAEWRRRSGRTVVFTNGCFDLLHVGHVTYLQEAAGLGELLIVGVNSDASVRRLKGNGRPINSEHDRAAVLTALECVDHVLVYGEDTPHEVLRRLRPDILVKGGTYAPDQVVGREIVAAYGGQVLVTKAVDRVSTTMLLEQCHERACRRATGLKKGSTVRNSRPR